LSFIYFLRHDIAAFIVDVNHLNVTEYKCIGKNKNEIFFKNFKNLNFYSNHNVLKNSPYHGELSQWGPSNRPMIRPGSVKSLNAPMGVLIVSPPTGLCQEN